MPAAVPAVGALAVTIIGTGAKLGIILTSVLAFATSTALSFLVAAETRPDSPSNNLADRDLVRNTRNPTVARRSCYGYVRVGGPFTFIESTEDNKFLHLIVCVAAHRIAGFVAFQLDDDWIYPSQVDVDGTVITGKFKDKVRFKTHLGTDDQTVDPDLLAETSATIDYRGQGIAYIYARLEFDQDLFPTQVPQVSAVIKGKPVEDSRDGVTRWTVNAALITRDYMITPSRDGGFGAFGGAQKALADLTVPGNPATVSGAPFFEEGAIAGTAMVFDGIDDRAELPAVVLGAPATTIAFWCKTTATGIRLAVHASQGDADSFGPENEMHVGTNFSGVGRAQIFVRTGGGTRLQVESATLINDGEWHHVAAVIDPGAGVGRIYVDAVLETTEPISGTIDFSSYDQMRFGAATFDFGNYQARYWDGSLDEISIWDKALSQPEIAAIKDTQLVGNEANLIGYWPMEGDQNEMDEAAANAAANLCDEFVTVQDQPQAILSVDVDGDSFVLVGENLKYQYGDLVQVVTNDTLPAGLSPLTDYFVIVVVERANDLDDEDEEKVRVQLAASYADALASVPVVVTDAGVGQHTLIKKGEPRYAASGVVERDRNRGDIIQELLTSMAGAMPYSGGKHQIIGGSFQTPTLLLNESHVIGQITVRGRRGLRQRFNTVGGVYVSPLNNYQPSDYPPVSAINFVNADGGEELTAELDLPFTPRSGTAQRLAKIKLERHRREITASLECTLHAWDAKAGSTIMVDNAILGWSQKPFLVVQRRLTTKQKQGGPALAISLQLQEIDATVFDFQSVDEVIVNPAPPTNLPNPFVAAAPLSMTLMTDEFIGNAGETFARIVVEWVSPNDFFVVNDGKIEVQWKRTNQVQFEPAFSVAGDETRAYINPVERDKQYDVRIRSVNHLGVRSAFQTIFNFTVGASSSGATSIRDYQLIADPATTLTDFGGIAAPVDKTLDYGSIV